MRQRAYWERQALKAGAAFSQQAGRRQAAIGWTVLLLLES
jgi:hypothetical protein